LRECDKKYLPREIINDINIKTLNYIKHCEKMKPNRHIQMTRKYLTNNRLLAVPFDKGIGFCLMTVDQYRGKMDALTGLSQFTRVINTRKNARDSILKEEDRIVTGLKDMLEAKSISKSLFDKLKPSGSQPPRLYGLAKVHKKDIPMRPVLSMPGSPYYKIGQYLSMFLGKLPECMIKVSSSDISESLKHINIRDDEELVSFDVTSLYTNVPVVESISVCADLLYSKFDLPFKKDIFIELAMLASCNVLMLTHDGYFTQTEGLAMGSSLAPYLANGWLNTYDTTIAMVPVHSSHTTEETNIPEDHTASTASIPTPTHSDEESMKVTSALYARYMDDIIMIVNKIDVEPKLREINHLHPALHFTMERENEGTIPFLDMLLIHGQGNVASSWYTKPTDTNLMMNYHALAPLRYKKSIVVGMVHRIYRACSSWENIDVSLQKAKLILMKNQYPPSFFDPIINETLTLIIKPESKEEKLEDEEDKDPFLFFTQYRGKCSDEYAKDLRRLCSKKDAAFRLPIRVVFTLKKVKSSLPSLKEPVTKLLKSGVVYHITCPRCQSSYVGETVRHLLHRFREHRVNRGPLKTHLENCNTDLDSEDIKILATSSNPERLLILEALFIKDISPTINTKDEFKSKQLRIKF